MDKSRFGEFLVALFWRIPVILIIYYLLTIPDATSYIKKDNVDENISSLFDEEINDVWIKVDGQLNNSRYQVGCSEADSIFNQIATEATAVIDQIEETIQESESGNIILLENYLFEMGAYTYHCPRLLNKFIVSSSNIISSVKKQSLYWDLSSFTTKKRLHNIYAGSRAMIDEILKHNFGNEDMWISTLEITNDSIRSGDYLLVRQTDPVFSIYSSANLFPGSYSNIFPVYPTKSNAENSNNHLSYLEMDYLKGCQSRSSKDIYNQSMSRVALCRLNRTSAELRMQMEVSEPDNYDLYDLLIQSQIPFDFSMDGEDTDLIFDYEMISLLSEERNITLSGGISSFENEQLKFWLSQIGMEYFNSTLPSDLTYDHGVTVLREWINPNMIIEDHISKVSMERILALSSEKPEIPYRRWYLPIERFKKGYSMIMQFSGKPGIIPFGLNSTESLKFKWVNRELNRSRQFLKTRIDNFYKSNNRYPTYLEIRAMAENFS